MQYVIAFALVLLVAFLCFLFKQTIGYKTIALLLLMTVSFIAMLFEIFPVLFASVLSALVWNFFFIPPLYTFHIDNTEDLLMFLLYFVIALLNAVLTNRILKAEKKVRDREEKENTIKLYNTLFNSLSHELKTPLATIIASTDTLLDQIDKLTQEQINILIQQIALSGKRLNEQVKNLLNMSRLETGMLTLKKDWCDVNDFIFDIINKMENNNQNSIKFRANESLPLMKFDEGLLQQVINNIISNALQHNPSGTLIFIKVNCKEENFLNIKISDNGDGVSKEFLKYLFDKFYRVPNSSTGGTGLGLSIAKGYVEAMLGTIEVTQNNPQGLSFELNIPVEISYINKLKNE